MADWITYKLKGADELSRIFKTLPQELQRQVVVPAAKDAMDIALKDAQDRAFRLDRPDTFPAIYKNFFLFDDKKFFEETGSTKISVGVRRRKKGVGGGNTYYWWQLEFGNSRMRARPFLRPALHQNTAAIFREFLSSAKYQLLKLDLK